MLFIKGFFFPHYQNVFRNFNFWVLNFKIWPGNKSWFFHLSVLLNSQDFVCQWQQPTSKYVSQKRKALLIYLFSCPGVLGVDVKSFLAAAYGLLVVECGIYSPVQGLNRDPLCLPLDHGVLTTGLPGKSLALLLQWKSRAKAPICRIASKCTRKASVIFLSSQPAFSGGVIFLILALPVSNKEGQPAALWFYFLAATDAEDLMTKTSSRNSLTGSVSITDPSLNQLL